MMIKDILIWLGYLWFIFFDKRATSKWRRQNERFLPEGCADAFASRRQKDPGV